MTLGTYVLSSHSLGRYLVLDADDETQWKQLQTMAERLHSEGVPNYLEASRRGGHQWLFLPITIPGMQIRRFAQGLLKAHRVGEVEVFPKQARLTTGPGSLIRLPFGVHQKSGKRYGFYHPTGEPLAGTVREQIKRLSSPQTVPLSALKRYGQLAAEKPESTASDDREGQSKRDAMADVADAPLSERLKAAITARAFIEQYAPEVRLNDQGIGYCPFHEDNVRSFGVNEEHNFWHCFAGCGGGSIIDFWMCWRRKEALDSSFNATIKDLAGMLLN